MIHYADADCHFLRASAEDEEIAHRIAKHHAENCRACRYDDYEWLTRTLNEDSVARGVGHD